MSEELNGWKEAQSMLAGMVGDLVKSCKPLKIKSIEMWFMTDADTAKVLLKELNAETKTSKDDSNAEQDREGAE